MNNENEKKIKETVLQRKEYIKTIKNALDILDNRQKGVIAELNKEMEILDEIIKIIGD